MSCHGIWMQEIFWSRECLDMYFEKCSSVLKIHNQIVTVLIVISHIPTLKQTI